MTVNALRTDNIVRLKEGVIDEIYNFRPSDAPLCSMIGRDTTDTEFVEWTADTFRAPNAANAVIEGANAVFTVQIQPGLFNNRHQIFEDSFAVTGTSERVKKYGRAKEVARLRTKKMVEIKRDIDAAAVSSPVSVTRTGAVAGRLRGLFGFIQTNNQLGTGGVAPNPVTNVGPTAGTLRALTEALVKSNIRQIYENGGDSAVLMVSPAHRVIVSTFPGNVTRFNEVGNNAKATLNTSFQFYGHEFGVTKIVPNRIQATAGAGFVNTAYIIDPDKIALGQLRPMQSEELAKTGDSFNHQVLTEVTLLVKQESTLGAVRDLIAT